MYLVFIMNCMVFKFQIEIVLILYDIPFKSTADGDIGVAGRIVRLPAGSMV